MTAQDDHEKGTTNGRLNAIYRMTVSIDDKVENILKELQDLVEMQESRGYRDSDLQDYHDDNHVY